MKTYGANYNAAAHLRRAHFNPCRNKRGGRGKKSENRGGMGGGSWPSMDFLKEWMYETYEQNLNGRHIVQEFVSDASMISFSNDQLAEFGHYGVDSNDYNDSLETSPEEDLMPYDDFPSSHPYATSNISPQQAPITSHECMNTVPFPMHAGMPMHAYAMPLRMNQQSYPVPAQANYRTLRQY